jgi:type II restriction enzyme
LTEDWFGKNVFCPICGKDTLTQSPNNSRVRDFFCDVCNSDYELKSKEGALGTKITDGGYKTMISRIESLNNPHFFFLTHQNNFVDNLFFIPNYFFTPAIIEPRKPLSSTARREGWMGCKINIGGVPEKGKIFIIKNSKELDKKVIKEKYEHALALKTDNLGQRGWLMDILNCIDTITSETFSLDEVYKFENELKSKHPDNNFIRDKIRQQLQLLRDKDIIEFVGQRVYRKKRFLAV